MAKLSEIGIPAPQPDPPAPDPTPAEQIEYDGYLARKEIDRQCKESIASGVAYTGAWLYSDTFDPLDPPDTIVFGSGKDELEALVLLATAGSNGLPPSLAVAGNPTLTRISNKAGEPVVISITALRELVAQIRLHILSIHQNAELRRQEVAVAVDPSVVDVAVGWPDPDPILQPPPDPADVEAVWSEEDMWGDVFPAMPYPGKRFYRTDLNDAFRWDPVRQKWLGESPDYLDFGRNNSTSTGSFFRRINGMLFTATRGVVFPYDVTVVGYTIASDSGVTGNMIVTADGATVSSIPMGNNAAVAVDDLDDDITALARVGVRNNSNASVNNTQGTVKFRRVAV